MASVNRKARADAVITMRMSAGTRDLIDDAAVAQGKSRTEFMVDSARRHALDVLLDQRLFALDDQQSDALADLLARPAVANDVLRALFDTKAPWT